MDIQLKRGLLEICVLTVLNRGDSYGYQIIKDVSPYIEISESTLYPILKRLETTQCVVVNSVEHNGRLRKYYKITEIGRNRIVDFLDNWKEVMTVYNFITEEMRCYTDE
ncbi:PadR family transcriptional regulator [Acetobacterium sp.]|jgi:PadR family transcriptional regulator PadR|uniref:PadR family transcriptional regulator n=1 Tax=Acetobacterium sp. TaxID=1872094 RepID=UPI000CC6E8C8|nr:PadR family transcriptional regulator [Acetobacterium sp.]MDO9492518.1 PadR family transcriptional regulator [Acetobacterium sp.]PKM72684.1 MAG: PadR family transcriptional regulator [Firmicutes bacterium HGW-Firmicutes-17]